MSVVNSIYSFSESSKESKRIETKASTCLSWACIASWITVHRERAFPRLGLDLSDSVLESRGFCVLIFIQILDPHLVENSSSPGSDVSASDDPHSLRIMRCWPIINITSCPEGIGPWYDCVAGLGHRNQRASLSNLLFFVLRPGYGEDCGYQGILMYMLEHQPPDGTHGDV